MPVPFVTGLRVRADTIRVGDPGTQPITIRVQLATAWDAVRVEVASTESVAGVKVCALEALDPGADAPDQYVVTLRGTEIMDESISLANAGVMSGSTLLVAFRHRQAVR